MNIDLKTLFKIDNSMDEKSSNALLKALNEGHLNEFDYLKFKASVENLVNMNMDLSTGIKSAFATVQTLGITKEYLIQTVTHYENILSKEKGKFADALNKTMENSVNSKKTEKQNLINTNNEIERKINELKNTIDQNNVKLSNIDTEIADAEIKIENAKNNYISVLDHLENIIKTDKNNIQNIL